jgi:hypothetical protein
MAIYNGGYASPSPVTTQITWVEDEAEARNTYVMPGSTALFMEKRNAKFHIKTIGLNGDVQSFRSFEFTEIEPTPTVYSGDAGNFVTKDDFNAAMADLKKSIEAMSNRKPYNKPRNEENHG